jgi:hypothetical protein
MFFSPLVFVQVFQYLMFTAVFELKNLNILLPLYLFCNVEEKCHFASTVRHKERPIILSGKIFFAFSRISALHAVSNNFR